jgi:hypothetical protein
MRNIKSERLKKLEIELNDLEQWLKLGLVPKKDIEKHREEIQSVKNKIEEERDRLHFLRESGEVEEYVMPKRPANRAAFADIPSMPDIDLAESAAGVGDTQFDIESETSEMDSSSMDEREDDTESDNGSEYGDEAEDEEEDESYFSDRNRWRRGGIIDPDADEW